MKIVALLPLLLLANICPDTAPHQDARLGRPAHEKGTPVSQQQATHPVIPPSSPQKPLRVGGEVKPPVAIAQQKINFEECVKQKVPIGIPILEVVIDASGQVQAARLLKPLPPCAEAAVLKAVKEWRFKPGTYRGQPVPVFYNMTVMIHYR